MSHPTAQPDPGAPVADGPVTAAVGYLPAPPPVLPAVLPHPWGPPHLPPVASPVGGGAAGRRRLVPLLTGALVLALVGATVAVTLLVTREDGATAVAGPQGAAVGSRDTSAGGSSSGGAATGGSSSSGDSSSSGTSSSIYNADEREFMRDFREFASARAGSTDDFTLVGLGYTTCEFLDSAGGSDAALVTAVEIGVDAGWSDDDATALVAASVVNLCPEYG